MGREPEWQLPPPPPHTHTRACRRRPPFLRGALPSQGGRAGGRAPYLGGRRIWEAGRLAHTVAPTLGVPRGPAPRNMRAHPSRVHRLYHRIGPSRLPLRVVLHSRRPVASGLSEPQTSSSSLAPGRHQEAASLGAQPDFASAPPRPAREAAVCRSLCSSRPVSPGRRNTRAAADLAPGPADKSRPAFPLLLSS